MLSAVGQKAGKGTQTDAVRLEVEGLPSGNRLPKKGVDPACEYPRGYRSDTGRLSVDRDLGLAKGSIAATLKVGSLIIGHTEIPELVIRLALRNHVKIDALGIGREAECLSNLIGCCI